MRSLTAVGRTQRALRLFGLSLWEAPCYGGHIVVLAGGFSYT